MLWGLYRLSNEILGGLHPEDSLKAPPKGPRPQAPYGGKTASPKKEGEIQFCVVLRKWLKQAQATGAKLQTYIAKPSFRTTSTTMDRREP